MTEHEIYKLSDLLGDYIERLTDDEKKMTYSDWHDFDTRASECLDAMKRARKRIEDPVIVPLVLKPKKPSPEPTGDESCR